MSFEEYGNQLMRREQNRAIIEQGRLGFMASPIDTLQLRREALDAALRLGGFGEATGLVKQAAIIEAYLRGDEA